MNSLPVTYGTSRERAASVSFAEIEMAARKLMAAGEYPSVTAVRQELTRGSSTTIHEAMRRFWKDQAALNAGNPVALTRLPPEFADAAVELWEQALRLSMQTANTNDNAARVKLEELRRDTDVRARSLELREKAWDMAARVRERALVDAREQINLLLRELANATAELRSSKVQIADLESQIEQHGRQLATVVTRALNRHRTVATKRPHFQLKSKKRKSPRKPVKSTRGRRPRKRSK